MGARVRGNECSDDTVMVKSVINAMYFDIDMFMGNLDWWLCWIRKYTRPE